MEKDISFPSLEVKTILLVQLNDSLKLSMKLTYQLVDNSSCNNESSMRWRDCSLCGITEVGVAVAAGTGAIYSRVPVALIRKMWRDVIGANPRRRISVCVKHKNNVSKILGKTFDCSLLRTFVLFLKVEGGEGTRETPFVFLVTSALHWQKTGIGIRTPPLHTHTLFHLTILIV